MGQGTRPSRNVTRARARAGVALLAFAVCPIPPDDDSTAFLTAARADIWTTPADPSSVSVNANDGRYIAFTSYARLTPDDTNDYADIYVLDRTTRNLTLETPQPAGSPDATNASPRLSGDGRFLVYETSRGEAGSRVIVLRDRSTGMSRTVERPGVPIDGRCRNGVISADGRTVVFTSGSTNVTDGPDANGTADDVYRFDIPSSTMSRISVGSDGRQLPVGSSFAPSVSADGRYVAFSSTAPLDGSPLPLRGFGEAPRGARPTVNVYVRDLTLSVTTRVSARADGGLPNASSYDAAISGDGRYVAFVSEATDLVRGDGNRASDIFLFDAKTRTTELVSRAEAGGSANGASSHPAMSTAGTVLVFQSDASDLTCARRCPPALRDINLVSDIFAFDRRTRVMRRISTGRSPWAEPSLGPAVDGIGAVIAFSSRHPRDSRDVEDDFDLFVRVPVK
jgi:Tol biopolymer transport system component